MIFPFEITIQQPLNTEAINKEELFSTIKAIVIDESFGYTPKFVSENNKLIFKMKFPYGMRSSVVIDKGEFELTKIKNNTTLVYRYTIVKLYLWISLVSSIFVFSIVLKRAAPGEIFDKIFLKGFPIIELIIIISCILFYLVELMIFKRIIKEIKINMKSSKL